MKAARVIFAGLAVAHAAPVVSTGYPDVSDPSCVLGQKCPSGGSAEGLTREVRSICVNAGGSNQCWDACNRVHPVTSYSQTNVAGIALMVKQLRTGMRFGSCPVDDKAGTCNPGERCTPPGLTWGRGMCITSTTGQGNQCLDMCDSAIPLTTFKDAIGKQAGTVQIVEMVRGGRDPAGRTTCPMPTIWIWLWIPLLSMCAIGACAGTYYLFRMYGRAKKGGNRGYREPEQPYADDQAPYVDYNQDYQQDQDFGGEYQQDYQEGMAPPQTMEGMDDPMPVVDQGMYAEPAVAEPNLFDQPSLMAPLTKTPSYQAQPLTTMFPGTAMAAPMTLAPTYTSNIMAGGAGYTTGVPQYTTAPQYTSAPQYTTAPQYGAYGAYGGATATTYPGTTSMQIR